MYCERSYIVFLKFDNLKLGAMRSRRLCLGTRCEASGSWSPARLHLPGSRWRRWCGVWQQSPL